VPHLSPTALTTDEQRVILRATAGNVRDHTIISLALGTGLRLAEIVGLEVGHAAAAASAKRQDASTRAVAMAAYFGGTYGSGVPGLIGGYFWSEAR
jgi:integrase